jgi:hypothetical protein
MLLSMSYAMKYEDSMYNSVCDKITERQDLCPTLHFGSL